MCAKRSKALLVRFKSGRFKVTTIQKLPSVACMSAKPLNCVDRAYRSKPEGVATAAGGRMVKSRQGRESVHREACRPQGIRSPQRQFSPVKSVDAGGDAVNVAEASNPATVTGEGVEFLSGFEAVACMR